jgi:AhpD family alkylhydroperoxidase
MSAPDAEISNLYSAAVEELVAIGAAIACNCEPCFRHHFRAALNCGVSRGDVALAVATARKVKEHIAEQVLKTAGEQLAAARDLGPQPGSCCCAGGAFHGQKTPSVDRGKIRSETRVPPGSSIIRRQEP